MSKSDSTREHLTLDLLKGVDQLKAGFYIIGFSLLALAFLFWLIYFKEPHDTQAAWVYALPAVNATLNTLSTFFLVLAYRAIRYRRFETHMRWNLAAFGTSTAFLLTYVLYHNAVGHTPFTGEGWIRPVYFGILISHIILSALVMPLILATFYLAFSGRFGKHRRLARITLPIWMYVSVTGVAIFLILRVWAA